MAKLYFKVASDWEEVVKLRNEIGKLKNELKNMDSTQSPAAFKALNTQLAASTQRMDELVTEAAKAGSTIEGDFKRKIFDASQTVNGFTEKIIAQKAVVKDIEADVRRLGEAYRTSLKRNPLSSSSKLDEYSAAKKALNEEKAALFGLTQEQANARLSVKKLRDEYALYKNDGKKVIETNRKIGLSLGKALGVIGGVTALKQLGSEIIRVRGEFQSMQTAIETMVGKDMAGKLIPQIKELAKISPLTMSDMVGAEKMMLGFNIQADDTIKYLKALSDISMGESGKFNSLTLAFSQMSAAGKLMGQDLNQMINAGFNPLQIIAEKTGKSIATLKEEMSKGAVSAEMVQQAFIDATSAGGKFYGMSENASKTINGQISMMQDAWDNALNEIGKSSEGFIMSGIQATTSLIQNYETIGKILVGMIATYGVYKTALIANITLTRGWAVAARADAVAKGIQTIATKAQTVAQLALNSAMKANPYVLVATLIMGAVSAMWAMSDSTTAAARAQKKYNKVKEEAAQREEKHRQEIDKLLSSARDESLATLTRQKSLEELRKEYPKIFEKYDLEKLKLEDILKLKQQINEEDSRRSVQGRKDDYNTTKEKASLLKEVMGYNSNDKVDKQELTRRAGVRRRLNELYGYRISDIKQIQKLYLDESAKLKHLQKDVLQDNIAAYKANLKNYSKEKLEAELKLAQSSASKRNGFNINGMMVKGADLESVISSINNALTGKKPVTKDYNFWDKQKKEATVALKSIDSVQKKMMDLGNFKGIDSKVVDSYRKNTKLLKEAEKELKVYDSSSKKEKEAEKQKKEQLKSSEELLSLRRQNQQDEINLMKDGSEKKMKQIELDYQKEIDAIKKQEKEWSDKQGGKLTQEQSVEISARYTHAENKKDKSIADLTKEELKAEQQALNDYLKEYGTFQQQKLAIAQEYAEKIKKAQEENGVNSPQVKLLVKERDVALQNKETESIQANIDWVTVFGEFGSMFNDMIKPALEEAKKYVQTDKFKNSDQASQKALIDAINQMEKSLGGARGLNFKKLGKDVQTYQNSLRELNDAKNEEAEAIDKLIKAQENYEKVIKNGTEEEKKAAKEALDTAQQNADAASVNVQTQTNAANESQQNLTDTATKLKANMDNVVEGLSKLASGGISSAYQGLLQAGSAMKGAIGEVTKNLKDVPIIGWIVAIIDVFKDGLSNVVGGLLDAVFNAVSGILSDVLSGDLFVTIGESLVQGISKIFDAITFGGFSSWTNSGESDPHLKEDIEHLTTSNQDLKNAIDNLAEKMDNASVFDSIELYNQQKANLEQQMYNTQEMMRRSGEAYSNGFIGIGGSHSSNKKINDEMSSADWGRISRIVGTTVNSSGDFWRLTSEQMAMVSLEATDLYTKIKDAADDGYEDAAKYMDTYIGYYKELEELQNRYYEKLTSTSFDSVKDNFRNSLLEMKDNAEAFTEDFEEMMQNALLEIMMTDVYDKQLQRWYDNFAKRVESGGELTTSEIEASKREYIGIVEKAKTEWEKYQEMIGSSSSSQESTKKGFAAASQDSIEELNGRFTALQIAGEEIKNQNILQTQSLTILSVKADSILSVNTDTRNIADEIRTIQVNSYLELQEIRENTGAIIKPIRDMAADIAEVKKNTSKL